MLLSFILYNEWYNVDGEVNDTYRNEKKMEESE